MKNRSLPPAKIAAAAVLLFGAISAHAQIKLGFHAPMTGPTASDGKAALTGAQIAVDWINAKGGVLGKQLELVAYDDQGKADQAIPLANKLIGQDKVAAAISGGYSLPTRAAAGVFQKARVPYFAAYAVHPDITAGGNYVFRGVPLANLQGELMAEFTAAEFGKKKVSLVSMDNDFGQAIAEGFKKAAPKIGLATTKDFFFPLSDRQFGTIVAGLKAENPDVIAITAYYFVGGPLVTQLRAAGLKQPIVGAQAFDASQFISIAKQAAEGVYVVNALARDNSHPDFEKFKTEFQKRAGFDVDSVGVITYDSITIVADAIKRAGSDDPKKIRDALAATSNFNAMMGKVHRFNANGEISLPIDVVKIKDGVHRHYKTIDDGSRVVK
jgi:branched-chain amino acid transport system substrate-binding protein